MAIIRKKSINVILAWLLGFIVCNNVFYCFQGVSSNINISEVYSLFLLVFLIVQNSFKIPIGKINKYFESGMKIYSMMIYVLLIPSLLLFQSTSYAISPLKGAVAYLLILSTIIDVILLKDNKSNIIDGLKIGIVINILFSFFQLFCYLRGISFSLATWFPQIAFQENIYWYRAQGLFLETSYYAAFISITICLLFVTTKSLYKNIMYFLSSILLLGISFTGNIVNFLVVIFLYLFIVAKNTFKKKTYEQFMSLFLLVLTLIICCTVFSDQINSFLVRVGFGANFSNGLFDAIITNTTNNSSNAIRLEYQTKALSLIPNYFWGVGYNMSSSLLQLKYGIVASFNVLVTNQLELGFIGTISYILVFYHTGVKLLLKGKSDYQKSLGIAMIAMFVAQVGNGFNWFPFCALVYALASIEYSELGNVRLKQNAIGKTEN